MTRSCRQTRRLPRLRFAPLALALSLFGVDPAAGQLRLVPINAETGEVTAARIRVEDNSGPWFLEPDATTRAHLHHRLGGYVHADGVLEIRPAKGPVRILASRGLCSVPLDTTFLYLGPTTVELPVRMWIDPASLGWYGADPHVHGEHAGGAVYPAASDAQAAVAARAEGLDLVFLLDNRASQPGGPVLPPFPGVTLARGEEYRSDYWGHVVLLGLDELVLGQGYAGCCGPGHSPWPTLHELLRVRPASLGILAHPVPTHDTRVPWSWPRTGIAREARALALEPTLQAMAVGSGSNEGTWSIPLYLDALASGARWAAVGEGDVALDRHDVAPPGAVRTYARPVGAHGGPGDPALAARWQRGVEEGASFATTGPVFTTLAMGPGSQLTIGFRSRARMDSLVLHGPGGPLEQLSWPLGRSQLDTTISLPPTAYVVAELSGPDDPTLWRSHPPRAVSSPLFADGHGAPVPTAPIARRGVEGLRELADAVTHHRDFSSVAESLSTMVYLHGAADRYEQMVDDPHPPFELLSPLDDGVVGSARFALDWEHRASLDGDSRYYRVRIGATPGLLEPAQDFLVAAPPVAVEGLEPGRRWYWSVEGIELGEPPVAASNGPASFVLDANTTGTGLPAQLEGRVLVSGGRTRVLLRLPSAVGVELRLFDLRGREAGREELGRMPAGDHVVELPARDRRGARLARGSYQVLLLAGGQQLALKVLVR